jgi:hypothetical protein
MLYLVFEICSGANPTITYKSAVFCLYVSNFSPMQLSERIHKFILITTFDLGIQNNKCQESSIAIIIDNKAIIIDNHI